MVALAVQQLAINPLDRRDDERISLGFQVTVHFHDGPARWTETDAVLVDLSPRGLFVRCDRVPRHGQPMLLGMIHERLGLCAASGSVVRFDGWGGFGARFTSVNAGLSTLMLELRLLSPAQRIEPLPISELRVWLEPAPERPDLDGPDGDGDGELG